MTNLFHRFLAWLNDPFGRRELLSTHEAIIRALEETTDQARDVSREMKDGRYPIGSIARRRRRMSQREVYHA